MKIGAKAIKGYAYGAIQPVVLLQFEAQFYLKKEATSIAQRYRSLLKTLNDEISPEGDETPLSYRTSATKIVLLLDEINKYCGDLRFTEIKRFEERDRENFVVPTLSTTLTIKNLHEVIEFITANNSGEDQVNFQALLKKTRTFGADYLIQSPDNKNFIKAAARRKIPFQRLPMSFVGLGYGSGSTILTHSVTDKESFVGAQLSARKTAAKNFMQINGFPVPEQAAIASYSDAKRFANDFGYPVVLKPESGYQGRGVVVGIGDDAELQSAFTFASKVSRKLVLEKHAAGDHYRLDFHGDELLDATRRRPASVVGDGKKTLEELIEELNLEPQRQGPNSTLVPIDIDEDLLRTIAKQRVSLESIPAAGKLVMLRSISNISRGGVKKHVEDIIHPENLRLCRSIAHAFRLNVAGIDIISPDLSKPWHENGAVVCEVNAGPQMYIRTKEDEFCWRFLRKYLRPQPAIHVKVSEDAPSKTTPLFDTQNSEINLILTPKDVIQNGCPTQYFNSLEISEDVTSEDRTKIKNILTSVPPIYLPHAP